MPEIKDEKGVVVVVYTDFTPLAYPASGAISMPPKAKYLLWRAHRSMKTNPGAQVNGRIAGQRPKHAKTRKTIRPRRRAYGPF